MMLMAWVVWRVGKQRDPVHSHQPPIKHVPLVADVGETEDKPTGGFVQHHGRPPATSSWLLFHRDTIFQPGREVPHLTGHCVQIGMQDEGAEPGT